MTALWGEYETSDVSNEEVLPAEIVKLFIMKAMQQDPYRVPLPLPKTAQDQSDEVDLISSDTLGLEMDDTVIHTIKLMQHSSEMTQLIEAAKEQTELMADSQINTFPPALSIPQVPEKKNKCRLNYPIPHLNKDFSDFTLGRGPEVPEVTFKTAKKLLKKSVAALLAHAGYHTTKESVLNTFSDVVEEYIKKMTMLLRVAVDQGANVMATGFPDAMERVFHDMNIGSLRCIHKYYQNRVIKYHEKLLEECKLLNWEYNNISIPMKSEVLSLETIAKRLTATQCLAHPWLRRKPPASATTQQSLALPLQSDLDLAKDNLKFFVERWNEHPNSPYLFDTSYQTISPCVSFNNIKGRRSRTPSSSGCSPSPCGSISSLVDSNYPDSPPRSPKASLIPSDLNNTPCASPKSYYLERLQHFDRRASDSSCFMRGSSDIATRINLAEEIKKLSDKLLKINRLQLRQNNGGDSDDLSRQIEPECNLLQVSDTSYATESFNNGYYFSSTTLRSTSYHTSGHRSSVDLGAPRRKFKFSNTNRDVPIPVTHSPEHRERAVQREGPSHTLSNSPDLTSNLLHLLDKYENEKCFSRGMDSIHRKSLSVEWSELESLGQKTMKSLTNFIETSRNAQQSSNKIITSKID